MQIRLCGLDDLDRVEDILIHAKADMNARGLDFWDNIYPTRETYRHDIADKSLYGAFEGELLGVFTLNAEQEPEYSSLLWKYDGPVLVVHRLCIHPEHAGKGMATSLMQYAEQYAAENGYNAIRLDSYCDNERANRMYHRLGYEKAGYVTFRKGSFACFEKHIGK